MAKIIDLTNQRFGKLVVLFPCGKQHRAYLWKCQCDCGNTHIVRSDSLIQGRTTRCKECAKMKGGKNSKWNDGIMMAMGYRYVLYPEHKYSNRHGRVAEHRLVMEQFLNRLLLPEEQIHHIDGHRDHNDITNLRLFPSLSEHQKYHRWLRREGLTRA